VNSEDLPQLALDAMTLHEDTPNEREKEGECAAITFIYAVSRG